MAVIGNIPNELDLNIYAGNTLSIPIACTSSGVAYNMTGGSLLCEIRNTRAPTTPITYATMTVTWNNQSQGLFTLSLTATQTAAFTSWSSAVWDCTFTDASGNVLTLFQGTVTVVDEVSY